MGTDRTDGERSPEQAGDRDRGHAAARRLVDVLAAGDHRGVVGVLAPDVRLRYLIPGGPGEAVGAADVAATCLDWFADADAIHVRDVSVQPVSDRVSARYRFVVHEHGRWEVIEQQAYLDVDPDGRILTVDLLCSGFRPAPDPEGTGSVKAHEFDAGDLGCADGLAPEFRRRIGGIPVGDVLVVTARDPAAKEDLPPLARMMGHVVRSIETQGDGRLVITVERGR